MSAEGDRLGQVIGEKWTVERFLGKGSMATVYAVRHRNGARAALKVLHKNLNDDEGAVERFLAEGALANTVEHPGIAKVLDDGKAADGTPYLVMELLDGMTLEQLRVARGGYVAPLEMLELAKRLLDVLVSVHEAKVIHRDLKPTNVFLTNAGEVKLLDFGLARSLISGARAKSSVFGVVMGTPSFMSPEQALGKRDDVDAQSDVWSAAAILFTLLTGQVVHPAPTIEHRLIAAASKHARSIKTVMPTLDPKIVEVIDKALAFEKKSRFATMREMRDALIPKTEEAPAPVAAAPAPSPVAVAPAAAAAAPAPLAPTAAQPFVRGPFDFGGDAPALDDYEFDAGDDDPAGATFLDLKPPSMNDQLKAKASAASAPPSSAPTPSPAPAPVQRAREPEPEPEEPFLAIPDFPDLASMLEAPPEPPAPPPVKAAPAPAPAPAPPEVFAKIPDFAAQKPTSDSVLKAEKAEKPSVASQSVVKAAPPVALKQVQSTSKPQGVGIPIVRVAQAKPAAGSAAAAAAAASSKFAPVAKPAPASAPMQAAPQAPQPQPPPPPPQAPPPQPIVETPIAPPVNPPVMQAAPAPPPVRAPVESSPVEGEFALPDIALPAIEVEDKQPLSKRHVTPAPIVPATPRLPISVEQNVATLVQNNAGAVAPRTPSAAVAPAPPGKPVAAERGRGNTLEIPVSEAPPPPDAVPYIVPNADARPMAEPTMLVRQKEPEPPPAKKRWLAAVVTLIVVLALGLAAVGVLMYRRMH